MPRSEIGNLLRAWRAKQHCRCAQISLNSTQGSSIYSYINEIFANKPHTSARDLCVALSNHYTHRLLSIDARDERVYKHIKSTILWFVLVHIFAVVYKFMYHGCTLLAHALCRPRGASILTRTRCISRRYAQHLECGNNVPNATPYTRYNSQHGLSAFRMCGRQIRSAEWCRWLNYYMCEYYCA